MTDDNMWTWQPTNANIAINELNLIAERLSRLNLLPTEARASCVKTIAQVLTVVLAHHETNISSLLVDSCTPSLCDFRYKYVLAMVDLARWRLPQSFPF